MANHKSGFYTVGESGDISFTQEGIDELKPYFAKAGISIEEILTFAQYEEARTAASGCFQSHLDKIASSGQMSLERRALMAAISDDSDSFQELSEKVRKKSRLQLSVVR